MELPFDTLEGRFVRLEPMAEAHREPLRAAVDCDPDTWAIMTANPMGEGFDGYWDAIQDGIATGQRLAYAIRRLADDRVVGTTSFMGLRLAQRGLEIGATFIHPDVRATAVNPQSKLLMMAHAFASGAVRVEYLVDVRNQRSQAAVEKLGAVREGRLRRHKITWTGHVRDTAVFSITDEDWPAVREGLEARLAAFAA